MHNLSPITDIIAIILKKLSIIAIKNIVPIMAPYTLPMGLEVLKVYGKAGIPSPPKTSPASLLKCSFFRFDGRTIEIHFLMSFVYFKT